MKAHAKRSRHIATDGHVIEKNGKHTHVILNNKRKEKILADEITELINREQRPNKAFLERLKRKGVDTTLDYIDSRITRIVSVSRYERWKYFKEKKQKYYNRGGRKVI